MEKSSKKLLGLVLASVSTLVATTALAAPTVNVSGLVQMDFASFQGDSDSTNWTNEFHSGGDVRRAKVALAGDLDELWSYHVRYDLANSRLDDAWLGFSGYDPVMFKLGRMDVPFGMDFLTGEANRTFMEAHDTLTVNHTVGFGTGNGHGVGLMASGSTDMMGYHFGAFLPETNAVTGLGGANVTSSDAVTWAGRLTFAPSSAEDMVYHFGASFYTGKVDKSATMQGAIAAGPMVNVRSNNAVGFIVADGGGAWEVASRRAWGLEAAGEWGPLNAQTEYMKLTNRGSGTTSDADYKEWYVQAGYMLTGESRPYSVASGTFGRVSPASNMGAWEVALRYGVTDLGDTTTGYAAGSISANRGEMRDWTVGVNWFATDNVGFQFNYVNSKADYAAATGTKDRDLNIFALRAQYTF